jgi:hypothetical protein
VIGRLGGDEFAVLMAGITPSAAATIAENIGNEYARTSGVAATVLKWPNSSLTRRPNNLFGAPSSKSTLPNRHEMRSRRRDKPEFSTARRGHIHLNVDAQRPPCCCGLQ